MDLSEAFTYQHVIKSEEDILSSLENNKYRNKLLKKSYLDNMDLSELCTYQHVRKSEEAKYMEEDDILSLENNKYRNEILKVLYLDVYDDLTIQSIMEELLIGKIPEIEVISYCINKLYPEDKIVGLMLLFSFELFFATHSCICDHYHMDFCVSNEVKEKNKIRLKNLVENYSLPTGL